MKKKRLIPFKFLPAAWGLTGKSRELAEAEYYYDGYELEVQIASINAKDEKAKKLAILEQDFLYKKISEFDYEKELANINEQPWVGAPIFKNDPDDRSRVMVKLDYNKYFIEDLVNNGYVGSEDEMVNQWLHDLCSIVSSELVEESTEMPKRTDGRAEYS